MSKTKGVYCLTSPDGKRYVGISVSKKGIEGRWRDYKSFHCKGQKHLYNALKLYGPENFKYEVILETKDADIAYRSEMYLIDVWELQDPSKGYNIAEGGQCGGTFNKGKPAHNKGIKSSKEAIKKLKASCNNKGLRNPRAKIRKVINRNTLQVTEGCLNVLEVTLGFSACNIVVNGYSKEYSLLDDNGNFKKPIGRGQKKGWRL